MLNWFFVMSGLPYRKLIDLAMSYIKDSNNRVEMYFGDIESCD